jgi:molybdopterin-binding protein
VTVEVSSDTPGSSAPIVAALTTRSAQELVLREGTEVWASFKAMAVHLC